MSAIITGRVFWTVFVDLSYSDRNGKVVKIKETTAKIVMLAIADSADDYGENSWQSFETIASKASIERRSAIRVVRALIEHKYLTIAGITKYGTNNFSINKDILGNPPAKRAKVGRPKGGDPDAKIGDSGAEIGDPETLIGDSGAEIGDLQSPDPSLNPPLTQTDNHPLIPPADFFQNTSVDWKLAHGQEVTQEELDAVKTADQAPKMFEKAFGFGTLPWKSSRVWEKFAKFVTEIYQQDQIAFGNYVIWRGQEGKYVAMSNKQIRMNPQIFMDTGWPDFQNSKATTKPADDHSKYLGGSYAEFIEH
jgi:hypothetical protein